MNKKYQDFIFIDLYNINILLNIYAIRLGIVHIKLGIIVIIRVIIVLIQLIYKFRIFVFNK